MNTQNYNRREVPTNIENVNFKYLPNQNANSKVVSHEVGVYPREFGKDITNVMAIGLNDNSQKDGASVS